MADSPDEFMKMVVEQMLAFTQELDAKGESPEDNPYFKNILVGILKSTYENYRSVEIGVVEMPTRAAWGARNLLELGVITTYVLASEENAEDFMGDYIADLKEFWEAMTKSGEAMHKLLVEMMRESIPRFPEEYRNALNAKADEMEKNGPSVSGPLRGWKTYVELMEEFGLDPKRRPKQGSAIAGLVHGSEMFAPKFKIHSKIVHPTAFSILATTQPGMYDPLLPLMLDEASTNVVAIFSSIRDHVKAHGLGWA
jgi:hypothetical protein